MTIEEIKKMPPAKYRIGDVAELIGMSRDSLRYYEKRGLLREKKEDNGYRYYTDEDLSRLISIVYERKMGLGLDEIALGFHDAIPDQSTLHRFHEQLEKEQNEIRKHQQAIARIQLSLNDYEQIVHHGNEILTKDFPASYVIVPETTFSEGISQWFRLASSYPGLDMMYVYDTYTWKEEGSHIHLDYQKSQLIFKKEFHDFVEYPFSETATPSIEPFPCLFAFSISSERLPQEEQVRALIDAAKKQGLTPAPYLYSTFIGRGIRDDQTAFHMQIYLPFTQNTQES